MDLVFNIAEGTHGAHRESHVPAILETLGIPFTGSSSATLALALDKARTKQLLRYEGIPTPAWQLFVSPHEPLAPHLSFPLFVKPNREGSAKGIIRDSIVTNAAQLRQRIRWVLQRYQQEVLVEEYIEGTELTVGVLGNDPPQALPILEIDFASCRSAGEHFYSWHMKEVDGQRQRGCEPAFHCPARVEPELTATVQAVAVRAHQALGCCDLSRTDIRLRADGTPFVLEINPLPGLSPTDSNFPLMTNAAGITHSVLIARLVDCAFARYRQTGVSSTPVSWTAAGRQVAQVQEPTQGSAAWRDQLVESRQAP